jgi:multidrug transporter EmrE-like cation transporter
MIRRFAKQGQTRLTGKRGLVGLASYAPTACTLHAAMDPRRDAVQFFWLAIAIVSTVGYHMVLKVTPPSASPFLSLATSYAVGSLAFLALYFKMPGGTTLGAGLQALNWTAPTLAAVVVLLDLGYLLLYRAGFNISFAQLITQSAGALILLGVGVAFFQERLTAVNVGGIALCVVGLWMINSRPG